MKKTVLSISAFLIVSSLFAYDFRNTTWLMSKEQVIESETDKNYSQKDNNGQISINYQVFLNGHPGLLVYAFANNQLISGMYIFDDGADKQTYLDMHEVLVAKYGKPDRDSTNDAEWNQPRTVISVFHRDNVCIVAFEEHDTAFKMLKDMQTENNKSF